MYWGLSGSVAGVLAEGIFVEDVLGSVGGIFYWRCDGGVSGCLGVGCKKTSKGLAKGCFTAIVYNCVQKSLGENRPFTP